jgi:hypothetical protein
MKGCNNAPGWYFMIFIACPIKINKSGAGRKLLSGYKFPKTKEKRRKHVYMPMREPAITF